MFILKHYIDGKNRQQNYYNFYLARRYPNIFLKTLWIYRIEEKLFPKPCLLKKFNTEFLKTYPMFQVKIVILPFNNIRNVDIANQEKRWCSSKSFSALQTLQNQP